MTFAGTVVISNTTFYGNEADEGAGINMFEGNLSIENCTFSNNLSVGWAGAIESWNDPVTINHSTFFSNTAQYGGSIYGGYSTFQIKNSIIAGSPGACTCFDEPCSAHFIDQGHNIEDTNTCYFSTANGSMPDTDPLLMPLADNGGSTLTHALMPASPAIDKIDPVGSLATDQRGVIRPIDGDANGVPLSDIGSFEVQLATTTRITGDAPDPSQEGEPFTVTFIVTSTYGTPTGLVNVTVSDSDDHCMGTLQEGAGSCLLTLSEAGVYTLIATYLGAGELGRSSDDTQHTVESSMVYRFLPVVLK